MPSPHNPLFLKENSKVPGWSILLFVLAIPLIGMPAAWLLPDRSILPLLSLFFTIGLAAVAVSVAPLGWAAFQALAFRPVRWRVVVGGIIVTTLLSFAVSQLGIQPQGIRQVTDAVATPDQVMATLAVLALLAPLVEELVFRGLLYGWIAGRWNHPAAFVVSSLTFAAAHVEPAHALLVFPLGLWFGWLRWRTDSLLPSLAAHMVNNGVAVAAAAYLGS